MNKEEAKKVKAWLYSIPTTERSILNLEMAISELETELQNPPSYIISGVGNYSGVMFTGGECGSKSQDYSEWLERSRDRLAYLRDIRRKHTLKVGMYRDTLDALKQEPQWGYAAGEIVRKKYYDRVRPDRAIYTMFLFISAEWYYKLHRRALQYYYDVLPNVFA